MKFLTLVAALVLWAPLTHAQLVDNDEGLFELANQDTRGMQVAAIHADNLADLKKVSGDHRESVVREAFKDLLKGWGRQRDLVFIPEYKLDSATKDTRFVDGAGNDIATGKPVLMKVFREGMTRFVAISPRAA